MIRETAYNDVYDAQRHFRTLLDCMARPGKINHLAAPAISPPAELYKATACIGFALLNADVSYYAGHYSPEVETYLRVNTHSRVAPPEHADFLFLAGDGSTFALDEAKVGAPMFPDTNATAVIQVARIGRSSAGGGLELTLEGPGIETREVVCVTGLTTEMLNLIKEKNCEFPLGVDAVLVSADDTLLCLPRTCRVTWAHL